MAPDSDEVTPTTTGTDAERALLPIDGAERRFGRYQLAYEIASGGMATVYLARAKGPSGVDRPFAIKRIHPHLAKQQDFVDMFLDEARLASRIQHPNVCRVEDFGDVDGTYYIAMEYLLGRPLTAVGRAVMGRPELLASQRWQVLAARIIADACEGLHAAHELTDEHGRPLNVVHRDVTPHNLFLTYEGAVKVVDFGVAWAEGRSHETRTGAVKGKFAYMSPEQVRGRAIDRRLDVWALGVCLWELLTGRRLFGKRSDVELIHAISSETVPTPRAVRPVIPALAGIVMRALERDLDRRTPTARALGRELSTFVAASGIPSGIEELAELMQELDGVERTKRLDVVASMMTRAPGVEEEPTASGARRVGTATAAPPVAPIGAQLAAARPAVSGMLASAPTVITAGALAAPPAATLAQPPSIPPAGVVTLRLSRAQLGAGAAIVLGLLALIVLAVATRGPEQDDMTAIALPRGTLITAPRAADAPAPTRAPPPVAPPLVPLAATPPIEVAHAPAPVRPAAPERERSPARAPAATGTGTLNVATVGGWAEILVDGDAAGTTPHRMTIAAGRHTVELRREGHATVRRSITVRRGETARLVVPME